jgi:hypothetical protein
MKRFFAFLFWLMRCGLLFMAGVMVGLVLNSPMPRAANKGAPRPASLIEKEPERILSKLPGERLGTAVPGPLPYSPVVGD